MRSNLQNKKVLGFAALVLGLAGMAGQAAAQAPGGAPGGPGGAPGAGGGGRGRGGPAFDPAAVARGKTLFDANCASCHASDMRGAKGGINLVRSQLVLDDKAGEIIGPIAKNGHANGAAAKMDWTPEQMADVVVLMHSLSSNYRTVSMPPTDSAVLSGDPKAGEAYFKANCASCHSLTDGASSGPSLKGIGTKYAEPKTLQNAIVGGGGGGRGFGGPGGPGGGGGRGAPTTVTITMPDGKKLEGTLNRSDDFLILMTEKDGTVHNIRRDGDVPKVEIHNPKQAHLDLFLKYTDKDIHNLTAYLVTMK
jgi:cytochrome c oxidase cbb3-type subunit 3